MILAGGSGTRLWPASRRVKPKQFLALAKPGEPMVAAAVAIGRLIAEERVLIVTAEAQAAATRAAVPGVELSASRSGATPRRRSDSRVRSSPRAIRTL